MSLKNLLKATGMIMLLLIAQISFAQNRTITGKVTDSKDGSGVAGATVSVKGTRTAVVTTADGSFSLSVPSGTTTLVISSVGFGTQEVSIEGKTSIDVSLVVTSATLNEVVVTGYGTSKRKDLTGSIATISSKDFVKGPLTSPEQLINGKVAGVQITTGGGAPGAGSRIRVRGTSSLNASNDPLIIIDGVPVDQQSGISGSANALALINPNDIESFNILKDASATAIYGNRASNGVIIITTKKGKSGKLKINFSTQNSLAVIGDKVNMMNADEFRTLINGKGNVTQKALLGTANTKWQDLIYRKGFGTDNNIGLTGGLGSFPYRVSLGFLKQNGTLRTGDLQRVSTALNINPSLLKKMLKVDFNFKGSFTNTNFANEGAIGSAAFFDPTQPVNRSDNRFGGYFEWLNNNQPDGLAPRNPMGLLNLREDKSNVSRFITNLQLDYTLPFFRAMRVNVNVGIDHSKGEGTINIPDSAAMTYIRGGVKNQYEQTKNNKILEAFVNYGKDIKKMKSRVDAMAGYGYQDFMRESPNFPDKRANGTEFAPAAPFPFKTQNTLISFFGRLDYNLMGRYILRANIRRDGSSRFSKENRWGNFPSIAFAWRITDEPFFKRNPGKALSDLKFRIGVGETGQQEIFQGDYPYLPIYSLGAQTAQYQFGSQYFQVYRPAAYDPNIKWETTKTFNIGFDFGFAGGRITGNADYYNKKTKDLISFIPIPVGTNFSNGITTNVGNMDNNGIEVAVNAIVIKKKNLNWDFGVNFTWNTNEITKLTRVNDPSYQGVLVGGISGGVGNTVQIHSVGYRPNSYYLLQQVYDKNNKPIEGLYVDRNGDGIINNNDYYRFKSPEPNYMVGFSSSVSCHQWTVSTVLRSQIGNYMYNNVFASNGVFRTSSLNYLGNVHRNYQETGFGNNQYFSDYYLENATFLRMDNFTVGYDFGQVMNNKANLRATFNVQNVFILTKYRGLDPEISGGIDNNFYPRPRIYSLGFNLDF
jgi:TonB-dependent starch-binding outer membrane protein SusC